MRRPVLPLLLAVVLTDYCNAGLLDWNPLRAQNGRPSLASDIRSSWDGLLGYSPATLLHARGLANASASGNAQCIITLGFTQPALVNEPGSSNGNSTTKGTPTVVGHATPTTTPATSLPSSVWQLSKTHGGDTFFNDWDFFTGDDPTHGTVQYIDGPTAFSSGLASINSAGNAIMAVDTTQNITGNRRTIRITTNYQYTGGLLVLDAVHAPTGCAVWPAFWSNGPNWPNNGEIDIMEGVNDLTLNQASVHTSSGCHISDDQTINNATGTLVGGSDCASAETNNGGCGQQDTAQNNTHGPGFNSIGGGVYAMVWDETGIAVYFFNRSAIPADITGLAPQPQNWGLPFARWPATNCNSFQFFQLHSAIFDTTLCGDWAGNVWTTAGSPGQAQSCAQRTGFATCAEFVQNSGASFQDAYWEVKTVRLYQKNS